MPVYEVCIEPLEPLLFGDNRSARAGLDPLQRDQDPSPLTIHGAIGRYLADRFNASRSDRWPAELAELLGDRQDDMFLPQGEVARLLGYCVHGVGGGLYFPRPLHLRCTLRAKNGEAVPVAQDLLSPREAKGARTCLSRQEEEAVERLILPARDEPLDDEAEGDVLLSKAALKEVLCGNVPQDEALFPDRFFRAEPRPGIAVNNDAGTVFEGAFFTRPYRRFRSSGLAAAAASAPAGFAAWLETLAPVRLALADDVGFLGGDRRRARFELREIGPVALSEMREQVAQAAEAEESTGFLLSLLTPALPTERAVEVNGLRPVAAALGKPDFVSGWDVKENRPRPIRALVPAGSVYFFDWPQDVPPGPARAELVRRLWLHPLFDEGAAAGFGRCLPGIWR